MKNKNIKVSIIIVNYKVEEELLNCISSIINSKPKMQYEIIVVDNGSGNNLRETLRKIHLVKYVKPVNNIGFGAGNNLGSKYATGKYIFFLNPDTELNKGALDTLFEFIDSNPKAGMVAPLLYNSKGKVYPLQGTDSYTFLSAIVVLSFINRLFPNNSISKKFFHKEWDKKESKEFDVVPGTAFMIRKDLFKKIGMFDEKYFLYFEEYDLAEKLRKFGCKSYIIPQAKVLHVWEASAKKRKDISKIFSKSRNYFFKKNYGKLFAFIVALFSNIGKYEFIVGSIAIFSVYLSSFKIEELMPFIGDQGWFYLSARDMLMTGQIPLVGIASSHPWLHQGPLWTYLLSLFLWIFNFNPVSGAYLTIFFGLLSIIGIYVVGASLFSKRVGLISSLFYATSPLIVQSMRFPYHTSLIPFFVIVYIFSLNKIINNKLIYLPLAVFLLGVLYNLEIATVAIGAVLVWILISKLIKKEIFLKEIINKKILTLSIFSFIVPLLPILLYDVRNGFSQTLKFVAWILYRVISLFSYNSEQAFSVNKIWIMFNFLFTNFTKLVFVQSTLISFVILVFLVAWAVYVFLRKRKKYNFALLLFLIPFILVFFNQTTSDAYLPMFFPIVILLFSLFLEYFISKKIMIVPITAFIIILITCNVSFMVKNNFMFDKSTSFFTLSMRLQATQKILNITQNKDYNLIGKGPGSEFKSFTMNYEYLAWWLGHGPSKKNENLKISVLEFPNGIKIEKNIQ